MVLNYSTSLETAIRKAKERDRERGSQMSLVFGQDVGAESLGQKRGLCFAHFLPLERAVYSSKLAKKRAAL